MVSAAAEPAPDVVRFAPAAPGWRAFWEAAATAVDRVIEQAVAQSRPVAVVVPRGDLVAPLRQALHQRSGRAGRAWVPPPIRPLDAWAAELAPASVPDPVARQMRLLDALDEGLPAARGGAPADRLARAQSLLQVLDAVTLARCAGRLDDAGRLQAIVDAFGAAAAEQLVRIDLDLIESLAVALDNASSDAPADVPADAPADVPADAPADALGDVKSDAGDPVRVRLRQMRRLAAAWQARGAMVVWVAWQPPEPLDAVLLEALAAGPTGGGLVRIEPDWVAVGRTVPVLAAAWPETFAGDERRPLRERRDALRSAAVRGPEPEVLLAADREREAQLAAEWVHARLAGSAGGAGGAGGAQAPARLAIVALDRWLARRVRALLERAQVLVDDREGWLLSTTVAASAVMGWLDVVAGDGYHADLAGWLDSRFVRLPGHREIRRWVERRTGGHCYLRGWTGLLVDGAPEGLAWLAQAADAQRRPQSLERHLAGLGRVLEAAHARERLQADEAGRQLLAVLGGLERAVARAAAHEQRPVGFGEFRALIAAVLERHRFFDSTIESPVEMTTLRDAAGRPFDAVLVLGAAHGVLPSAPPPLPLVNEPLRVLLGLPTAAARALSEQRDLALLLALSKRSAATCRSDPGEGVQPGPWIERLHAVAGDGDALAGRVVGPGRDRELRPAPARMPSLAIDRLPAAVSVAGIDRLVSCPFRFLAHDAWLLREPQEPADVPGRRERGEFVHEVLHRFHLEARERGLRPEPACLPGLRALLDEVTDRVAADEATVTGSQLGEIAEWRAIAPLYLEWLATDAGEADWRWLDGEQEAEVTIRWGGGERPRSLRIRGRLDRLDAGGRGLRVVDYKLGDARRLGRTADDPASAAQLVLYAWMAAERGSVEQSAYLSLQRDGVKLVPLAGRPADAVAGWRRTLPDYLARIESGERLSALGADCGHCVVRGVCRKGHWS